MKEYTNGERTIQVSEKAFNLLYKKQGFYLEDENVLEDLTVKELKDKAKELDLEGYSKLNKEELIELIAGD